MTNRESAQSRGRQSPWRFIARYKRRLWVGAALLLVTNAFALTVPWLLGRVIDALERPHPAEVVAHLALLMVAAAVCQATARIGSRIALFNGARMAEYDLRSELFSHLMALDAGFFGSRSTGDVMSRLTNDVQTVRAMWGPGLLNIVNTAFIFTAAVALMIRIDPWLTLWAMLPYPGMVLMGRVFGRQLYRRSRGVQDQLGDLSSSLQEDLTGIGVIKAYTMEEERKRHFADRSERLLHENMELTKVRGQLMPILGGLASLGTVAVLWIGGRAVIRGRIDLGQMIQFNAYLALLVWPTMALGWMLSLFQRGLASWSRIREVLETQPKIVDGPAPAVAPSEVRGEIEIRDLTLALGDQLVLDRVSLSIPAGSVTAIVGRTGSGKSTLVEALPRLLDVPPGTIFLDGRDITEMPLASLRRAIGYAPQEAFLFSTTIARNIAYGFEREQAAAGERGGEPERPHPADAETAPTQELAAAATAAGLTRDLAALPHGYDTVVGERGITLSGGQRQRVALARAIATEPRVLILDDSLSSVDAETEREILTRLDEVMAGRTAILISHRVAAVRRADQIVVLDAGRVTEVGTHDELLAKGGLYAELYQSQLTDEVFADEAATGGAREEVGQ